MFTLGALTFHEFMTHEPLPLATIHQAVLEFLRERSDVVLFGAQAVNVYVDEARMSADVDVQSTRGHELAEELRAYLSNRFHIAVRVREVAQGKGLRLYQIRKEGNRHLVDIRPVETFPPTRRIAQVLVPIPEELIAQKVIATYQRSGQPKSFTDRRDVAMLLLAFPDLKKEDSAVKDRLRAAKATDEVMQSWSEIVKQEIRAAEEDDEFR